MSNCRQLKACFLDQQSKILLIAAKKSKEPKKKVFQKSAIGETSHNQIACARSWLQPFLD